MKAPALISFKLIALLTGVILAGIVSCKKDPEIMEPAASIQFQVPAGWPQPVYRFENNQLTQAGFDLGKKLFFDGRLSRTNTISCGSCHQPATAFSQIDHPVSHGVDDKLGTRNSPALFNLAWQSSFFWDGNVGHIENQPLAPITNPVEMDEQLDHLIAKLQKDDQYPAMFKAAFGDETINTQRISKAITQFQAMLISNNSKYDQVKRGESSFTDEEASGYRIFQRKCESCHQEPLFTDGSFRNNGLPVSLVNDSGRAHVTHLPEDLHKFKVPSLRNLRYSAPYMHDGRFGTIETVVEFYRSGTVMSPTLDTTMLGGVPLSNLEKSRVIAFLNTLNDETFTHDERFRQVR